MMLHLFAVHYSGLWATLFQELATVMVSHSNKVYGSSCSSTNCWWAVPPAVSSPRVSWIGRKLEQGYSMCSWNTASIQSKPAPAHSSRCSTTPQFQTLQTSLVKSMKNGLNPLNLPPDSPILTDLNLCLCRRRRQEINLHLQHLQFVTKMFINSEVKQCMVWFEVP